MNSQEVISTLAAELEHSQIEVKGLLNNATEILRLTLGKQRSITIPQIGTFSVRKRSERKTFNALMGYHIILPPKLTACFRPGTSLKELVQNKRAL
jgi:nucleoid DNA-binding protein